MARPSVFGPPPRDLEHARRIRAQCEPRRIGLVNSLIDAYEGVAVVRTVDAARGVLEFWAAPTDENTLRLILAELGKQMDLSVEDA